MQCLGCLGLALSRYKECLEGNRWNNGEEAIEASISRGFALADLVKLANSLFGRMLLGQYSVNLFFTTFGIYFSTCVFNVISNGQVNEYLLLFCIANIALVVLSLYQLYIMQAKGQELCDHFSGIRENLEAASIELSRSADHHPERERRLQVLIARFSATTNSPVRPCDVFNMNAANFVSIGGIVLTYIIVLLQFKHSSGSGATEGLNLNFGEIRSFMQNKTMDDLRAFLNNRTATGGGGGGLFPLLAQDRPRMTLAERFGFGSAREN